MKLDTILWGTRIGAPDWEEEIITTRADRIEQAKQWAQANGFDRLRVATIDVDAPPDFAATVRRN